MEPNPTSAVPRWSRPTLVIVGVVLLAAAAGLGALIFAQGHDIAIDVWWNTLVIDWLSPAMTAFATAMNWLGGGWFGVFAVPIAGAVALILVRRRWAAIFFVAVEIASAGVVQILKHLFGRARPEDIIVISDYGSFPSGHVANAATLAAVACVIFPRLWVLLLGIAWTLLMALSRTYLHAHWLSDTLGGALVGSGVVLLLAAAFATPLQRELRRGLVGERVPALSTGKPDEHA